ncbi:MAG TPA: VanW family protein [Acidimicrobiales bacterium]|nr:VanW family protein [Acidimicrobiales bacterium]
MPSVRLSRRAALVLCAVVVLVAPIAGWIASTSARGDRAPENLTVGGKAVGGDTRAEVEQTLSSLATVYAAVPVTVVAGDVTITSTAGALGLSIDEPATVAAVMDHNEDGFPVGRFFRWVWSYVSDGSVEPAVTVDESVATAEVDRLLTGKVGGPVEPSFALQEGKLVAVAGHPGLGIETADVVAGLHRVRFTEKPVRVDVAAHTIQPRYSVQDAQNLVDEANELTSKPIDVKAGDVTKSLDVPTLRSLLIGKADADGLVVGLDPSSTMQMLSTELASATTAPQDASIAIVNGVPTPAPGHPGAKCCAAGATDVLFAALHSRPDGPVDLPMEEVPPHLSTEQLDALGIREVVASFTTRHKAGEARVTNIHRMADLVRGTIIRPGDVFSINDLIGQRTEAKGFVFAPAIAEGVHEDEVGGGVSQFATTLFNASFFAGLDFVQYQSHSLYISRYPYGREATLGWPGPDLQIRNTTPYGILIWPSYTNTSLTVTLFSTKYFQSVDQTNQTTAPSGVCTSVVTQRTRVYLDGTTKVDVVRARYRPNEGVNCDGTGPGATTTTTTTTVAPATTAAVETTTVPTTAAPPTPPLETVPTVPTTILTPSTP